ncbi:hypothetical protein AB0395_47090 [Streptosporangium sp. NPDC051023]|uniref:hypothetical protein n=1 Tax=Streptosporangium sp. NPDC051023 TaxID=3155410 RepID=UPI00344E8CA9
MNVLTPPTPENVAEMLTSDYHDYHNGNDWWPSISADGPVISVGITPVGDDYETKLPETHFQAHVFQVDPELPIASEPVYLDPDDARELTYERPGEGFDGWTVVANEPIDTTRWKSHHRLVIRNEAGEHFAATYSKGLTEQQEARPWDCEETARFDPVARRIRVVQVHEWVTPAKAEEAGQ